jgi:DNA-binding beta-propeller fold protein YncE
MIHKSLVPDQGWLVSLATLVLWAASGSLSAGPTGYVAMGGTDSLVPFDIETGAPELPSIELTPEVSGPYDVTIHPYLPEVWVVGKDNDGVVIINRSTNTEIARLDLAIEDNFLVDTIFSRDGETAFISNRDAGLLHVIDVSSHAPSSTVAIPDFPPGWMAVHPRTGDIYLSEWQGRDLAVIDAETHQVDTPVDLGGGFRMRDLKFSPDAQTLYIANGVGNDEILFVDPENLTIDQQVSVGEDPWAVDVMPDGSKLFTANQDSRDVSVIDLTTLSVETIDLTPSADPQDIDIAADGSAVFVPTGGISGEDGVFVIDPQSNTLIDTFTVGPDDSFGRALAVAPQALYDRLFADRFED